MPQSSTVNIAGWKSTAVSTTLLVLAVFSALMLFSFGGQVIIAPVLIPAQLFIARHTRGTTSMAFSVLGALLTAELVWIVLVLVLKEGLTTMVGGLIFMAGAGAGFLFFRASRPGRPRDRHVDN